VGRGYTGLSPDVSGALRTVREVASSRHARFRVGGPAGQGAGGAFTATLRSPTRVFACETLPAGSSGGGSDSDDSASDDSDEDDDNNDQVTDVPRGGVETGDGTTTGDVTDPAVIALGAIGALGVGIAAAQRAISGSR
jgi:hypothetical protein